MKNAKVLTGMLVLVLAFGMMAAGCGGGEQPYVPYISPYEPPPREKAATPTASPAGGDVLSGQSITLSCETEGFVSIYYTLDGSTPTKSSSLYSSYPGVSITNSCTLKAIATSFSTDDSEVLSATYTVAAPPAFSTVASMPSNITNGINSAIYGNNRFVVGGGGGIAYSANGTTWTAATGTSTFTVYGIAYSGTQFVAVGSNGNINYSSDGGVTWNNVSSTFGTSTIYDVAYGGGVYVAVGDAGKMAYSANGTTWTAVITSTFETSRISGITYAAGKFVAVGAGEKMAYSTNGTTWIAVTNSTFSTSTTINGITYGGPAGKEKFIAVSGGLSPQIAYSTDGITWTRCSQYFSGGLTGGFNRVAWGGNKYVAVAGQGEMYFSPDGTYWAKIDGGTGVGKTQFDTSTLSYINDIVYGGGKFLAVGTKFGGTLGSSTNEMALSD